MENKFDHVSMSLHRRIVAEHIMAVLKENKNNDGKGLRFRDIKIALIRKGWLHCDSSISINDHWLVKVGLLELNGYVYSIPDKEVKGE
jgi:hypothetical protein